MVPFTFPSTISNFRTVTNLVFPLQYNATKDHADNTCITLRHGPQKELAMTDHDTMGHVERALTSRSPIYMYYFQPIL